MTKTFSAAERQQMLALKGVGATVISRLEQMGFSALNQLKDHDPEFLTKRISEMMGSTCWHNSPMARSAMRNVVELSQKPGK